MTNAKKEKVASEKATAEKQAEINSREEVLRRLKKTQEDIKRGNYDTGKHVLRDLESAIAFLRVIQDNPEIMHLCIRAVEKSILSIPTDHAS